ncbi:MAG: hypothetical protein DMG58_23705, partial [Acidobacteria bacterium]
MGVSLNLEVEFHECESSDLYRFVRRAGLCAGIPREPLGPRSRSFGRWNIQRHSAEDGSYQVPFLNPGLYTITVEKTGFHRVVREGVNLGVSEKAVVDIQLTLGALSQSVSVTGDAALVETESADRGLTIENNRVENTPLAGRSIYGQAWSAPGVAVTTNVQRLRPWATAGNTGIAISGGQPGGNEVLIDGVSNLYIASNVAYVPPVEGTAAFKVQTTSYDAQ